MSEQKLGSYDLLEEIGKGGMATVFRARQPSIDRDVAIKLIRKHIADSPDAIQRFQREAQMIARLEHPHILPVYDFDGRHEPPYIVMRYLEGGTLKEVIAQGILPLREVAYLMQQVCSAVDYAHRQGIIHRDLKPSNILVDREGNAFVMDFGIARMAANDGKGITETGAIIGTPDYMSPEQASGEDGIDHRTDIYALGVMLFEMLTGELPFASESSMAVLLMHVQNPVPSACELNSSLPPEADLIIERVLSKDRDDRYESAASLSAAIMELAGNIGTSSPNQLRQAASTSIMRRLSGTKSSETGSSTGAAEQNKTVTAVYATAKEYASVIEENRGDEAAKRAMEALFRAFETVIRDFGGAIFARSESEILALWGTETARENDTEQAIRAALGLQNQLRTLGAAFLDDDNDLPLNIGINSGMALLKATDDKNSYTASGSTISIANRLMENAEGSILLSHDTYRQVMGIFDMELGDTLKLRGRKEPLLSYRVQRAKPRAFHVRARGIEGLETRMIGREAEFKLLQQAFLNAFEDEETQVITILGEAGFGKSRLVSEFDQWGELRPEVYRVFNGRASSSMAERPYALLRDIVSFRFDIQESDSLATVQEKLEKGIEELLNRQDAEMAHSIAYLCGFDLSDSPYIRGLLADVPQLIRRARQLFVRMITQLAQLGPVMMSIEDIHEADDASLDLFNELFMSNDNLSLLIICTARPALLERRPTWGSGQAFHSRIELKALSKRDSRDLAGELLQKVAEVAKGLRDLLVERSEGNPFYMEELVKMLLDERVLKIISPEEWQFEEERLDSLHVPKTLHALLQSRLDSLLYPEKLTLQRASVMGATFYDSALARIDSMDESHISKLDSVLQKLVERQFIYKRETSAFEGMTEYIFASNMLRDAVQNALLERQIANYNHACAVWMLETLGNRKAEYLPIIADYYEKAGEKTEAASYLIQAGALADKKGNWKEAVTILERAMSLISEDAIQEKAQALNLLGHANTILGETRAAREQAKEALDLAVRLGDSVLQARALFNLATQARRLGELDKCLEYAERGILLAESEPETLLELMGFRAFVWVALLRKADASAEEAITNMLQLARQYQLEYYVTLALRILGILYMVREQPDKALIVLQEGMELVASLKNQYLMQVLLNTLGMVARLQGNYREALAYDMQVLEIQQELGQKDAVVLSNLGLTSLRLNDPTGARSYAQKTLSVSKETDDFVGVLCAILIYAGLDILASKVEHGLALLGLADAHPAADEDLRADMQEVFALLPDTMTQEEVRAAMDKGKKLNMDEILKGLESAG